MTTCEAAACHLPAVARVTVQPPGWRTPETRAVCAEHHRQLVPPTPAPIQSAPPAPAPETKEAPVATKMKTCCMPGCGNQPKAKWLCQTHYRHLSLFPGLALSWPTVPEGEPTPADTAALASAWEQRDTSSPVVEAPEPTEAAREAGELLDTLTKERDTAREKAARLEDACRQWEETNRLQRGQIERLQADQEAERKAAMKLVTEHERLQGEHEALTAERDQLATEHETLTTELEQAHEDVDTITALVTDVAVRLVGPKMANQTTSGQLRGLHALVQKLHTRVAVAEGEVANLTQRSASNTEILAALGTFGDSPDTDRTLAERVKMAVEGVQHAARQVEVLRSHLSAAKFDTRVVTLERDKLKDEIAAVKAAQSEAEDDADRLKRLIREAACSRLGWSMKDHSTEVQLHDLCAEIDRLRQMGPQKSQRDPEGPALVDPTAALLLLDFARDLAGELDGELARAVFHAIIGARNALREQMADSVRGAG